MHLIYVITDEQDNHFYVGQTKNLKARKRNHLYKVKYNVECYYVHRKIAKLLESGKQIIFKIIENNIPGNKIDNKEKEYIKYFRDKGFKLCNLTDGGQGVESFNRKTTRKTGVKRSTETCKRISEGQKGRKFSEEHKEKLKIARRKRVTTAETRLKMSKSGKGKTNIKIFILTDPNGVEYTTREGLTKFCEEHGLSGPNLHHVLRGRRSHHKGWRIRE